MDFAVSADNKINLKESEKRYKFFRPCLRTKKNQLWNMKVTVILIVIGALGTIIKGVVKSLVDFEIRGQVETIQITALLGSARILRRVLKTWGTYCLSKLQWGTISKRWCEKLSKEWNNNEWRPSKLQHSWERPEYWEESWRLEKTCCHSNSSERPSALADIKNSTTTTTNYHYYYYHYLKNLCHTIEVIFNVFSYIYIYIYIWGIWRVVVFLSLLSMTLLLIISFV